MLEVAQSHQEATLWGERGDNRDVVMSDSLERE